MFFFFNVFFLLYLKGIAYGDDWIMALLKYDCMSSESKWMDVDWAPADCPNTVILKIKEWLWKIDRLDLRLGILHQKKKEKLILFTLSGSP